MTVRQAFGKITLQISGLAARRGALELFADLAFSLSNGRALALRGPNGAGKTTLLLMLAGIVVPSAGAIEFVGFDPDGPPIVHFCGHQNAIKARLSVRENLAFWAVLNGATGMGVDAALERVGLGAIGALDAGYLSAGQAKRLALARLLVSARPVWLLDEPLAALDRAGDFLVGQLLDAHLAAGGLVVAATHDELPVKARAQVGVLTLGATA